ncbi:hypothetical protein [Gorillibacterium sp. CAU 1737]|uniref:hypothetical protein n=1 Tax=Gorillibacterium sp. CAU 1737 TaxID=3140362 RepID=UPI003260528A
MVGAVSLLEARFWERASARGCPFAANKAVARTAHSIDEYEYIDQSSGISV